MKQAPQHESKASRQARSAEAQSVQKPSAGGRTYSARCSIVSLVIRVHPGVWLCPCSASHSLRERCRGVMLLVLDCTLVVCSSDSAL